jgi:serine/threonine protein kinase
MSTLTGHKLGKYQLVERLGQGGMAEVYKAFQPGVERFVATKVLHSHRAGSADFVARFQREARAIGRLQHPNIVRIIDFDVEGDIDYMVMDYVTGGTLSEYLMGRKALPLNEALPIIAQLAEALAYAHQQGMLHRDIKPGNILFSDETHTQVVLTDFGLARLLDDGDAKLTMTGAMIGTPTYMSPEAVRGEPCDVRADLYSLGVVLYEMVTGKTPYAAETPYSMMMKQANEPLPSPRALKPDLPEVVEALLLKALAKAPDERFQSAAEFASAIQQAWAALNDAQPQPIPSFTSAPRTMPMPPQPMAAHHWLPFFLATSSVIMVALLTTYVLMRF